MDSKRHDTGKRKALIIAVSDYDKLDNLDFCKNDGEAIHGILLSQDYEILEDSRLIGRVEGNMLREKIIDFCTDRAVTLEVPDSGGGVYLCASEVDADYPYKRGFSLQELTKMMNRSISKKIVTILDCCYSGSAEISKGSEYDAAKLGNAAILHASNTLIEGEGRCILASSQANQEAYALKEENNSVFTHFLIKGLGGDEGAVNSYGYVTVDSLSKFIYDGIMSLPIDRRPKQKPVRKMDMSGEIIIADYSEHLKLTSPDDIGKRYLDKKDYKKALEYYEKVTRDSNKADAWINKGIAHHKLRNYFKALSCFDRAIDHDRMNALALCYKGTTLLNLGK